MLDQVLQSGLLPYRLYDGSQVFFHPYLVEPPRMYMEELWWVICMFPAAQVTPAAENILKVAVVMKATDDGGIALKLYSIDGATGALIATGSHSASLALDKATVSIAGNLYGLYTDLHIYSLDPNTLEPTGIDYPSERWSESNFDPVLITAFGFDEYQDRAIMKISEDYNTQVSIYKLSTGELLNKVYVAGMVSDIAMESVGRCYVAHTNGVISVLDYLQGKVIGIIKAQLLGIPESVDATIAWDHRYKRLLVLPETPNAVDGASTLKLYGFASLPVATNITPPLPLRAPRVGRYVPVLVRAYGEAGEPIPAEDVTCVETGPGTLAPATKGTDEFGYAQFQYEGAAEGTSALDASAVV